MSSKVRRILFRTALAGVVAFAVVCTTTYLCVQSAGTGKCFDKPAEVPVRRVAMVLGCPKFLPNGHPSLEYAGRVSAAAELFKAGRCERVLVSSDVDAPAMLRDVCDAGVPYEKLDCDPKGVRTRASVVRAKEVFGITSGIVVSQRYHNERSIYIGEEIGADWVGYDAKDAEGLQKLRSRGRETLARALAWFERHVAVLK